MGYYGHDMDRDGKITSKDSALFHEMMDGKKQCDAHYSKSTGDIFGEGVMLLFLVFAGPLAAFQIVGWFLSLFH